MPRQPNTKTQSYASRFYAFLDEQAEETVVSGEKVKVWKGFIGETCRKLDIPAGMEQKVVKPLEQLGCIRMLERGVGQYPTKYLLLYPPTTELWEDSEVNLPLTRRPTFDMLVQRVENIEQSLGGVNLAEALVNIDRRLKLVESQSPRKVGNG